MYLNVKYNPKSENLFTIPHTVYVSLYTVSVQNMIQMSHLVLILIYENPIETEFLGVIQKKSYCI